jgi:hypothetical protein
VASRPPTDRRTSARRELHRQRSKLRVRTTAKSRILDRLTASPEQAIQRRRVGTSQIRRESKRNMQTGRSRDYTLYRHVVGTHVGRQSTNVHRRAPDVLDYARVDEPTRTESCSASPTSGGPIGINAAHVTPRKIRRSGTPSKRSRRTQMDCYLVLRRSSSSTGHADVTASRCHAATSNAVVGDIRLSSVRDASLDGTTHCCQSGGTHEPRSTSPVRSSPRRLGRANATWSTSRASHSLRRT